VIRTYDVFDRIEFITGRLIAGVLAVVPEIDRDTCRGIHVAGAVEAGAAVKLVNTRAAHEQVMADTALQRIVTLAAEQCIVAI
jgi:hypothetical protein